MMLNIDITKPAPQTSEIEVEREGLQRGRAGPFKMATIASACTFILFYTAVALLSYFLPDEPSVLAGITLIFIGLMSIILFSLIVFVVWSKVDAYNSECTALEEAPEDSCLQIKEWLDDKVASAYHKSVVIDAQRKFINAEITAMDKWCAGKEQREAYNEIYIKPLENNHA